MKAIAKIVAPATLALAAFSANASGLIEIDYPQHQTATPAAAGLSSEVPVLSWPISEAAPVVHTIDATRVPAAVTPMRNVSQPLEIDLRYFA